MSLSDGFAARSGPRPLTTDVNPHTQLDQNAPAELQDRLRDHALPTLDAERLIELGWAEYHNLVTRGLAPPVVVMIYGPRDEHELAVVKQVVELAYLAAGGAEHAADGHAIGAAAPA